MTNEREAREIIAFFDEGFREGCAVRWCVRDAGTGAFVGTCGFNEIVRSGGSRAEIAYDLIRSEWGRGHMRTLMDFMICTGFDTLNLHRLQAFVTPGNTRSARVLERCGFEHEGRLRGYGRWLGRDWDQDVWGLVCVSGGREQLP